MAQAAYTTLVESLERELAAQRRVVDFYENYYFGDHQLQAVRKKWEEVYGGALPEMTSNWCELAVNAAAGRLKVEGIIFPTQTGELGEDGGPDEVAAEIWEENGLNTAQAQAHTTAVYAGRSYALVEPPAQGETVSRITVEHPSQTYVRMDPASNRRRLAAIKTWWDVADDGTEGDQHITLFLPNRTYHLTRKRFTTDGMGTYLTPVLIPRTGYSNVDEVDNPLNVVPVVPLDNKPVSLAAAPRLVGKKMLAGTMSDLQPLTPLQDAIQKGVVEMIVIGEAASAPLRWATGVTEPKDPATGKPLPNAEIRSMVTSLLTFPDKDAKVGQLPPHDMSGLIARHALYLRDFGAQSRTPPHYMLGDIVNISGEGLAATETSLSERIREKHGPLGGGWEQATRIACGMQGDLVRFEDKRCKTSWANPEIRSIAQAVDAAMKLFTSKMLPLEMALEMVPGMTAAKIERAVHLLGFPQRGPVPSSLKATEDDPFADIAPGAIPRPGPPRPVVVQPAAAAA
ncbi:unannotated protein [freshwater metagenome]|uniref:Unannotated protein n=1 Tax=freshwater metagenome TaxID=449393 RepID=A0A6J7GMG4_9ZZZZ|nr:phage portal protein [Actinomycetota bacterium]